MATGHRINSQKCLSHQLSRGAPSRASYDNRYRGQMDGKDRLCSTPQGQTFPYSQGALGREGQEGFHCQLWPTASSCLAQWAAHLQSKPAYFERADMLPVENSVVCTCALSARKRKKREQRNPSTPKSSLEGHFNPKLHREFAAAEFSWVGLFSPDSQITVCSFVFDEFCPGVGLPGLELSSWLKKKVNNQRKKWYPWP